jgi:hypothetical protein
MPSSIKLTEPLDILVEYGYLDEDKPYHKALNNAVMDFAEDPSLGGEYNKDYVMLLQNEAKKELKLRRKKIDVSKFFGKKEENQTTAAADTTGTSSLAVRSKKRTGKIDTKKFIPEPTDENQEGGASGPVKDILSSVISIEETLNSQYQLQLEGAKEQKEEAEKKRRGAREKMLEGAGKVWDGIKSTGEKVIKPFQSIWSKILGFIQTIFFGRIFYKILEWMGNPDNHGKIQSIIQFFKDWWPTLLTAYLLFGNSFGRMAVKLGVTVSKFAIKLVTKLIPKMLAGLAKLKAGKILKGGLIGGALLGAGVIAGKMMSGGKEEGSPDLQPVEEDTSPVEVESEFKEGGFVSGPGGIDKVPARLTAGEFVMSKGAVQKYGADTLSNMNAAGGGTNIPTLGGYSEGGGVPGVVTDPKEKAQQEAYMLKFVNEERALQGMEPLNDLTYAPGVELTKMVGPGPRTTETSDTNFDFDRGIKTTSESKTMGDKTIMRGSIGLITEEDRQKFFAENPHAAQLVNLKDQIELDNLGADISASAKMNGGGLVQMFQGGGQVMQMGRGASKNRMKLAAQQKKMNTPGTSSGKKTTVAYQDQGGSMKSAGGARQPGNKELPSFSATAMRSPDKIRVLGISV